jgi:hypothetical protein
MKMIFANISATEQKIDSLKKASHFPSSEKIVRCDAHKKCVRID